MKYALGTVVCLLIIGAAAFLLYQGGAWNHARSMACLDAQKAVAVDLFCLDTRPLTADEIALEGYEECLYTKRNTMREFAKTLVCEL